MHFCFEKFLYHHCFQVIKHLLTESNPFSKLCTSEQPHPSFHMQIWHELNYCSMEFSIIKQAGLSVKMQRNVIMGLLNIFCSGPHCALNKNIFKGVKKLRFSLKSSDWWFVISKCLHPNLPKVNKDISVSP